MRWYRKMRPSARGAHLCCAVLVAGGLLAAAAGVAAAQDAPAWHHVDVEDANGWLLRDVSLQWSPTGRSLLVTRADGAEKVVAPEDIRWVGRDGADLTAEVARARPADGNRAPELRSFDEFGDAGGGPAAAGEWRGGGSSPGSVRGLGPPPIPTPFRVAFDLGAGYATTSGDWYAGLDSGTLLQAGVRVRTSARAYVHFVYRRQSTGTHRFTGYDDLGNEFTLDLDTRVDELLFLVGLRGSMVERNGVHSTGYFEFGLGNLGHRAAALGVSETISKLGFAFQAGAWFLVGDGMGVDVGLNVAYKPGFVSSDELGGALMGAHVGVMILIP